MKALSSSLVVVVTAIVILITAIVVLGILTQGTSRIVEPTTQANICRIQASSICQSTSGLGGEQASLPPGWKTQVYTIKKIDGGQERTIPCTCEDLTGIQQCAQAIDPAQNPPSTSAKCYQGPLP